MKKLLVSFFLYSQSALAFGGLNVYHAEDLTPAAPIEVTLPAPADVSAETGPYMSIKITFTDNSDLESWYEIQHSDNPDASGFYGIENVYGGTLNSVITHYISDGPFNPSGPPAPDEVFYQPGTTVYIRVRAVVSDNGSIYYGPFSPTVSAITNPVPPIPSDFVGTGNSEGIHLSWTDNSTNEAAFYLAKSIGEFDVSNITIVKLPENTTEYTDTDVEPNVTYSYGLIAVDLFEYTAWPEQFLSELFYDATRVATTSAMVFIPPAVPVDVTAEGISPTSILVRFTDNSDVEFWYEVLVTTTPDEGSAIALLEGWSPGIGSVVEIEAIDLQPETTYYFRVRGVTEINGNVVQGEFSNVVEASTLPDLISVPEPPTARPATFVTSTSFTANWDAVENADYYELDIFSTKDQVYLEGYEGKIVYSTSEEVTGVKTNKSLVYVVRAVNDAGESQNSNAIMVSAIAKLSLHSACSDDPGVYRWQVTNPNPFDIPVDWAISNTTQTGTFVAGPGESFFTTPVVSDKDKVSITWRDDNLILQSKESTSTKKLCKPNGSSVAARDDNSTIHDDIVSLRISHFPNPAKDKFNIIVTSPKQGQAEFEIITLHGTRMLTKLVRANTAAEIDVSFLSSGMYVLRARQGTFVWVGKMMKE